MPLYEADPALHVEQCLADGRWFSLERVVRADTDGGWVELCEPPDERTGRPRSRRVVGSFRVVRTATGEVNPPLVPLAPPPTAAPSVPSEALAFVNALRPVTTLDSAGRWACTFMELPEVVGEGATETEARAHARAQALDIATLVSQLGVQPPTAAHDAAVDALVAPAADVEATQANTAATRELTETLTRKP